MKTTEQIKSEVINYLTKTSNHLFQTTKEEFYKVLVEGDNIYRDWETKGTIVTGKHLVLS